MPRPREDTHYTPKVARLETTLQAFAVILYLCRLLRLDPHGLNAVRLQRVASVGRERYLIGILHVAIG